MKKGKSAEPGFRVLGRRLAIVLGPDDLIKASAGAPTCSTTNGASSSGCCGEGDDSRLDCPDDALPV